MELLTIKMLNTAIERMMNQEMSDLGLTYTQTTVIAYLIENQDKEVCQKDVEYNLGLTHPTVSSILTRMEKNGLICTAALASDHRYKRIILTEKALNLKAQVSSKYQSFKKKLFEGVSPAQRELMSETMQMMLENIK